MGLRHNAKTLVRDPCSMDFYAMGDKAIAQHAQEPHSCSLPGTAAIMPAVPRSLCRRLPEDATEGVLVRHPKHHHGTAIVAVKVNALSHLASSHTAHSRYA